MENYSDLTQAAEYCGITVSYLKDQCRKGGGPKHLRPSRNKALFRKVDLDDWIKSWMVIDNSK
jgi:hypothetical protein